ncbi:MAG: hypothetical protein ACE1ZT_00780, partial [Dehalococcoidia bacterium]
MSVGPKTRLLLASAVAALIAVACVGGGDSGDGDGEDTTEDRLTFDDLGLDDKIPLYTESWNTDWTKRTISLSEL